MQWRHQQAADPVGVEHALGSFLFEAEFRQVEGFQPISKFRGSLLSACKHEAKALRTIQVIWLGVVIDPTQCALVGHGFFRLPVGGECSQHRIWRIAEAFRNRFDPFSGGRRDPPSPAQGQRDRDVGNACFASYIFLCDS